MKRMRFKSSFDAIRLRGETECVSREALFVCRFTDISLIPRFTKRCPKTTNIARAFFSTAANSSRPKPPMNKPSLMIAWPMTPAPSPIHSAILATSAPYRMTWISQKPATGKYSTIQRTERNQHAIAHTLVNLGNLYVGAGAPEKARPYYLEALDLLRDLQDDRALGILYNNLALQEAREGQWEQAVTSFKQALDYHRIVGNEEGLAVTYSQLGKCFLDQGDLTQGGALPEQRLGTLH